MFIVFFLSISFPNFDENCKNYDVISQHLELRSEWFFIRSDYPSSRIQIKLLSIIITQVSLHCILPCRLSACSSGARPSAVGTKQLFIHFSFSFVLPNPEDFRTFFVNASYAPARRTYAFLPLSSESQSRKSPERTARTRSRTMPS